MLAHIALAVTSLALGSLPIQLGPDNDEGLITGITYSDQGLATSFVFDPSGPAKTYMIMNPSEAMTSLLMTLKSTMNRFLICDVDADCVIEPGDQIKDID